MRLGLNKSVSRRSFNFTSEDRIEKLKQIKLKKKTEAKCNWAVNAYVDWRAERLTTFNYDAPIYFADLRDLSTLTKDNLQHALCRFIPEVTKKRGEGLYPGRTLYQMIVSIQKHLFINKLKWKIIDGDEFEEVRTVLDNVMRECTEANIGVNQRQADIISYEDEENLWKNNILGEDTPNKLRDTVLFLIGLNVYLRACEEHYSLRRDMPDQKSQFSFQTNAEGVRCLVYQEDSITKTHDGGLKDMRRDRKVVWVYPNKINPARCPVRLVSKYMSLGPKTHKRCNFYLQSLQRPTPIQWYGEQVVGIHSIAKVVKTLMEEGNIPGFFTNHSTRRTGGTRLFRAGVPRKLVKEVTGHASDAVDKYQITSDKQREELNTIIARKPEVQNEQSNIESEASKKKSSIESDTAKVTVSEIDLHPTCKCNLNSSVNASNVGEMITKIVEQSKGKGKTVIKLEIEISHE